MLKLTTTIFSHLHHKNLYAFSKGFQKFNRNLKNKQNVQQSQQNSNPNQNQQQQPSNDQKQTIEQNNDQQKQKQSNEQPIPKKTTPRIRPQKMKQKNNDQDDDLNQVPYHTDPKLLQQLKKTGIILLIGGTIFFFLKVSTEEQEISFAQFQEMLEKGQIARIQILKSLDENKNISTSSSIENTSHKRFELTIGNLDHFLYFVENFQTNKAQAPIPIEFKYQTAQRYSSRIVDVLAFGITTLFAYTIIKSLKQFGKIGDVFGFGSSKAKQFIVQENVKIKFKDVAGQDEAKKEIREFVDFLKNPSKYNDLGAKIPRGALLSGPPGTGKTLLAKACAGEAGVPFFYISGSDFVEMFVGVGAARVRDLFKKAKAKSPSIIFIDEIDAVGKKRDVKMGGNDERDNTLNQLLAEMDGFGTNENVIILAATNKKDMLDNALTRPGRFDRIIEITLPDIEGRKQILLVHLAKLKLSALNTIDEYAKRLATLSPGFSGADLANLCNEAAILAVRKDKDYVDQVDFEAATERVIGGLEKKTKMSLEDKKRVAYHECGHAVIGWFLEGGDPLLKLTIIPRSKGSLGFAQYLINEAQLDTKQALMDKICCLLGGRCSEQFFFNSVSNGASDDLNKVYQIASSVVTKLGMSDDIGYIAYKKHQYYQVQSSKTQKLIDTEIQKIINDCTEITMKLIETHKDKIDNLVKLLMEKESLDLQAISSVLGPRPFKPKQNFKAYLEINQNPVPEETQKKDEEIKEQQSEIQQNNK